MQTYNEIIADAEAYLKKDGPIDRPRLHAMLVGYLAARVSSELERFDRLNDAAKRAVKSGELTGLKFAILREDPRADV